ncbi:NAD(P)H-binding protein [Kitasatospora sp. NPDC057223]|uniref:NAD(P)H-binding protein n=1 Tax=Kitasatospora sp. NPDC057223 TaxID=3346055 RepID=UPI0036290701
MLLVTGATGNVGRELVRALDAKDAEIRILVRDPARAAALPARAERVVGDLDDPATLAPAFAGVDGLFLLTPGIGTAQTAHAVAAARHAGVRHIVHLSSSNVLGDPMPAMGRWHHEREEIVRACGIPATILRPGGFTTNALEWAPTIREQGYVLDPVGPGRHAPVDPADIADVAALVLTGAADPGGVGGHRGGHLGKEYVLTGGEALTVTEQVRIIAGVIGRPIEVRPAATPAEAVRSRFPAGAPQALADAITEAFALMRADTTGLRTDTVERLLGRRPRGFADWCARNADAFRPAAAR